MGDFFHDRRVFCGKLPDLGIPIHETNQRFVMGIEVIPEPKHQIRALVGKLLEQIAHPLWRPVKVIGLKVRNDQRTQGMPDACDFDLVAQYPNRARLKPKRPIRQKKVTPVAKAQCPRL